MSVYDDARIVRATGIKRWLANASFRVSNLRLRISNLRFRIASAINKSEVA